MADGTARECAHVYCSTTFSTRHSRRIYCSRSCKENARRRAVHYRASGRAVPVEPTRGMGSGPYVPVRHEPRGCIGCPVVFTPCRSDQQWCTKRCRDLHRAQLERERGGDGTSLDRMAIYERDGFVCQLCGDPVNMALRHPDLESHSLDHIVPVAAGGRHVEGNVQLAHLGCNISKGARERIAA